MSTYAIGDIQGCYKEFKRLLREINFNKKNDTLWLAGDLVNRGPNSFDVIKYIMDLDSKAISVLGNHDFYLLASYFKATPWPYEKNNFEDILSNKDCDEIIKWLRHRKIIFEDSKLGYILVHAGIYPKWGIKETLSMASLIEEQLRGEECKDFIKTLWSNTPLIWNKNLSIEEKMIFSTNVFTRMRYLKKENLSLEFETKICPDDNQSDLILPWYDFDSSIFSRYKIITGHWSTLGFKETKNVISIDTGCVWKNKLTAIKILNNKKVVKYDIQC